MTNTDCSPYTIARLIKVLSKTSVNVPDLTGAANLSLNFTQELNQSFKYRIF